MSSILNALKKVEKESSNHLQEPISQTHTDLKKIIKNRKRNSEKHAIIVLLLIVLVGVSVYIGKTIFVPSSEIGYSVNKIKQGSAGKPIAKSDNKIIKEHQQNERESAGAAHEADEKKQNQAVLTNSNELSKNDAPMHAVPKDIQKTPVSSKPMISEPIKNNSSSGKRPNSLVIVKSDHGKEEKQNSFPLLDNNHTAGSNNFDEFKSNSETVTVEIPDSSTISDIQDNNENSHEISDEPKEENQNSVSENEHSESEESSDKTELSTEESKIIDNIPIEQKEDYLLQALVWSPEPKKRMIVINNQILRIGDSVNSAIIEDILNDSVIFKIKDDRWRQMFRFK